MNDTLWSESLTATSDIDRRESRAIRRAALITIGLLVLAILATQLGLTRPGIVHAGSGGAEGSSSQGAASVTVDVTNRGIARETLASVALEHPGLVITSARLQPGTLGAFEDGQLVLEVTVDCSAPARDGSWDAEEDGLTAFDDMALMEAESPLVIHTVRPWGTATKSDPAMGSLVLDLAAIACYDD